MYRSMGVDFRGDKGGMSPYLECAFDSRVKVAEDFYFDVIDMTVNPKPPLLIFVPPNVETKPALLYRSDKLCECN